MILHTLKAHSWKGNNLIFVVDQSRIDLVYTMVVVDRVDRMVKVADTKVYTMKMGDCKMVYNLIRMKVVDTPLVVDNCFRSWIHTLVGIHLMNIHHLMFQPETQCTQKVNMDPSCRNHLNHLIQRKLIQF